MVHDAKNILISGATGFIGSHLFNALKDSCYSVYSLAKGIDIADSCALEAFSDKNIDVFFHVAGRTFVPQSWENPSDFYKTNTTGTLNVLEFCRKNKVKLVYISAYLYGEPDYLPIDENHPVKPNNPYAHSKFLAENLCEFYTKNFGVECIILRPFNIYGIGQNDKFLIPSLIKQYAENRHIVVQSETAKRDYLYIDDFIKACTLCIDYNQNRTFNIGFGKSYSVKKAVDIVIDDDTSVVYECLNIERKNEIKDTVCDNSLAKQQLGWKPEVTLKDGIKRMKQFYENKRNHR